MKLKETLCLLFLGHHVQIDLSRISRSSASVNTIGFAFMVGAVGLGLGTVFIAYPVLQTILKYAGAAYLVYLAAAIAMSGKAP